MKFSPFLVFIFFPSVMAQNLQLHYDLRHTTDPHHNSSDFPTFSFEFFKNTDTVGNGSFLLKLQADLNGKHTNVSQVYTQISQSLKFWRTPIFMSLSYSGGLGVSQTMYGFYLSNSLGLGISIPVQWKGAWIAVNPVLKYTAFDKPSYDPQLTLYFGKGLFNYKIFFGGSFVFWTENRNQGSDYTKDLTGKKFAFFGDPQIWVKVKRKLSVGSRMNVYYHLLEQRNKIQLYPTLGLKFDF